MSVVMATMTCHPLPEDVVIEILSRLPVKNLLQFKCVCKSWYATITSPNFISKHLRNYYSKSDDSECLLVQYCVTQADISYPIGHWKNSKLILVSDSGELISCDPRTQEISGLGSKGWVRCVGVFAYKESLVLVNNGNGCERHNQKADTESDFVIRSRNARNEECFLMESYYDGISNLFD
ncbi:hypothetical protein D5086_013192 [Populus alba]|uniref:Uncharacterized protein n=1 Tax=Populus alba TaxID=43335 RepID=A0ACC4C5V1_POPAL